MHIDLPSCMEWLICNLLWSYGLAWQQSHMHEIKAECDNQQHSLHSSCSRRFLYLLKTWSAFLNVAIKFVSSCTVKSLNSLCSHIPTKLTPAHVAAKVLVLFYEDSLCMNVKQCNTRYKMGLLPHDWLETKSCTFWTDLNHCSRFSQVRLLILSHNAANLDQQCSLLLLLKERPAMSP